MYFHARAMEGLNKFMKALDEVNEKKMLEVAYILTLGKS